MKKIACFLLGLLVISTYTMGQNDNLKQPTLEELIPGGDHYLFTDNLYGLSWWGDICLKPELNTLYEINPSTGDTKEIATLEFVNQLLQNANLPLMPNMYVAKMPWKQQRCLLFNKQGKYIKIDLENSKAELLNTIDLKAANIDFNYMEDNIAYTIDNNLFINNKQITDNILGVVAGQSVHRNEFGIDKGTFWSPKGDLLAFYNMDETMVAEYPLVDITTRIATLDPVRYPMAGMASHKVSIGIYNVNTDNLLYLNTGDPTDRYFTNISWSPNQDILYVIELNRDQNHAKLCAYSATTGELLKVLIEETHPKYVEPQNPISFIPWNSKQFIYQSQKDGFNHLYLYNTSGKELKQLTRGGWLVQSLLGYNAKTKEVIVTGTYYSPLKTNTLAISLTNGKIRPLDNTEGVHSPILNSSGEFIIDKYSSPATPNTINLVNVRLGSKINLLQACDPYADYVMPDIFVGTTKAADGKTDLYYRLVQPKDINKKTKYPAVVYVYGGPHAQMINDSWNFGARGWDIYMANKGYVVLTIDNRGSSNRGLEFENATFRELGIIEGEDQVKGLDILRNLGYVDMSRIGVHGWSFGGHMTTALMLRYPNFYKVGVAGGPVIDWKWYEIMYGERYMDTPQSNPEGYEKTNLCNYAKNLEGKLLMIHDGHDSTCVPQHTYSFIKACIDARTYPDLFIYPGHAHNVRGRDRVHLHEKITQYFDDHL